jgi:hypothetical protein
MEQDLKEKVQEQTAARVGAGKTPVMMIMPELVKESADAVNPVHPEEKEEECNKVHKNK